VALAEAAVVQAPHRVVLVEPLDRLGGRLDLPALELQAPRLRQVDRQERLAGAGLALEQERPLQARRHADGTPTLLGHAVLASPPERRIHVRAEYGIPD